MVSKKHVFIVILALLVYCWIKYVKQGPVYKTDKRLDGKTVLITGGNAGVGKATAIEFAKLGANVVIASRNVQKSQKAKDDIVQESGNKNVFAMHLDLENFESIKTFAEEFDNQHKHVHYLINNAGVMGVGGIADSGYHRVFAINHFGPFLLTNLLMKKIKETSKTSSVRIVTVSAGLYQVGALDFDLIRTDRDGYFSDIKIYGQSKLANIMFTRDLNKRLKGFDVTIYSMHPGAIKSDIGTTFHQNPVLNFVGMVVSPIFFRDGFYGAQTILYCCLDDEVTKLSGEYFSNCKHEDLAAVAQDDVAAQKLWDISVAVTGKYLNEKW